MDLYLWTVLTFEAAAHFTVFVINLTFPKIHMVRKQRCQPWEELESLTG